MNSGVREFLWNRLPKNSATPVYVYSYNSIKEAFLAYQQALKPYPHLMCYAMKANSNIAIIHLLAKLGAGFDIVSGGELRRVIEASGDPKKVLFSGVGKTYDEIAYALETTSNASMLNLNRNLNESLK